MDSTPSTTLKETVLPLTLREHVAAALLFAEHGALWSEAEEVGETKEWLKSADVALNAIKAFPRDDSEVNKMSDAGVKALCAGVVPHDEIVSMHIDLWDRIVKILTTEQSQDAPSCTNPTCTCSDRQQQGCVCKEADCSHFDGAAIV